MATFLASFAVVDVTTAATCAWRKAHLPAAPQRRSWLGCEALGSGFRGTFELLTRALQLELCVDLAGRVQIFQLILSLSDG